MLPFYLIYSKRRKIIDDETETVPNEITTPTTVKKDNASVPPTLGSDTKTIEDESVPAAPEFSQKEQVTEDKKKEESNKQPQNKSENLCANRTSEMEEEIPEKVPANLPTKVDTHTVKEEDKEHVDKNIQGHEQIQKKASNTNESSSSFSSSSDSDSESDDDENKGDSDNEEEDQKHEKKTVVTTSAIKRKPISKAKVKSHSIDVRYDVEKNGWEKGKDGPYMLLAKAFATVENESGRIIKTIHLANAYRTIIAYSPQDLIYAIYLSIGSLAPEYEGLELGIGESALMSTISDVTGVSVKTLKSKLRIEGDLGQVAMQFKKSARPIFKPTPLTLKLVFNTLREIALTDGTKVCHLLN